jgi:hypothetical protein
MHSRSADCVRGVARLISSASSTFAKIGPGLNSNRRSVALKTLTPSKSDGIRSLVHWTRRNVAPTARANARASVVLPTPGTSSTSKCPRASAVTTERSTTSGLPASAEPTALRRRLATSTARATPSESAGALRAGWAISKRGA